MKKLCIFDFDGTLTYRDSLPLFLALHRSRVYIFTLYIVLIFSSIIYKLISPSLDWKGYIKKQILHFCLQGQSSETTRNKLPLLKKKITWRHDICQQLEQYKQKGYIILIASGALHEYLPYLLSDIPFDHILCSYLETSEDGKYTGKLKGENCVRQEKAQQVQHFIQKHGPFEKIIGYGNLPSDREMLALCQEKHYI